MDYAVANPFHILISSPTYSEMKAEDEHKETTHPKGHASCLLSVSHLS